MSAFSRATVDVLRDRSGDRCELCGGPAGNSHHRRPRGMGGSRDPQTDLPSNGLRICGSGTTGCHGLIEQDRAWARDLGYLVRQGVDPATVPVVLRQPGGHLDWVLLGEDGSVTPCCRCGLSLEVDCTSPAMAHLALFNQRTGRMYECNVSMPVRLATEAADVRPLAADLGVPPGTDVRVEVRHYGQVGGSWAIVPAVDETEAWLPDLHKPAEPEPARADLTLINERVNEVLRITGDPERAHGMADDLRREVIDLVALGHPDARALARAAQRLPAGRWCA